MVRSLNTHWSRRHNARIDSARRVFRDVRPFLAIIVGFAAVALLIDFCFACVFQAMR